MSTKVIPRFPSVFVQLLRLNVWVNWNIPRRGFNWGNIHPVSSCVKQVWLVMLINFCLLHLQYLGSLRWLASTASSERATSSLSGAGGNLLHTSNWTKCLSNSETSHTHQIIIQTRCQQRFLTSRAPSAVFLGHVRYIFLCHFTSPSLPRGLRT